MHSAIAERCECVVVNAPDCEREFVRGSRQRESAVDRMLAIRLARVVAKQDRPMVHVTCSQREMVAGMKAATGSLQRKCA